MRGEHPGRSLLGERDDVEGCAFMPGTSMPGDPIGIPGTAMPAIAGRSFSSRWTSAAGTCPSTTYPPTRAVWHERAACGI